MNHHIQNCLRLFQDISCFHKEMFILPLWNKYPRYSTDIWDSLAIFLEGYAFERQGRRPDFPHAGVDALIYCKRQNGSVFNQSLIGMIWQQFSTLLNNQRLNIKNNPLYPSNLSKPSLVQVALRNNIGNGNSSFVSCLSNGIIKNQDIRPVFNLIKGIRGIGDKITSLFLRDLVEVMQIPLNGIKNRQLLQPIDVWVRRTVKILSNNPQQNDQQVAGWIVQDSLSNKLNPERVNMGIWFFGSQIAKSEYRLRQSLNNNCSIARKLFKDYAKSLTNICNNCLNKQEGK